MKRPSYGHFGTTILIILMMNLSACSLFFSSDVDEKDENFKHSFEENVWEEISPDRSDFAFRSESTDSILLANSLCRKYKSTPLKELSSNILSGIEKLRIQKESTYKAFERDALDTHALGAIDGVPVFIRLVTLKKDRCIYDFVMISMSQDFYKTDSPSFERFMGSFRL